jgi:hypothetical protein
MRVMVILRARSDPEAKELPGEELRAAMAEFNGKLVQAGVLLAGERLRPSSTGVRVRLSGRSPAVIDGPDTWADDPVAGFWLWQVKSLDEAVEWARRCPDPTPDTDAGIEIRGVADAGESGVAARNPMPREPARRPRARRAAEAR